MEVQDKIMIFVSMVWTHLDEFLKSLKVVVESFISVLLDVANFLLQLICFNGGEELLQECLL